MLQVGACLLACLLSPVNAVDSDKSDIDVLTDLYEHQHVNDHPQQQHVIHNVDSNKRRLALACPWKSGSGRCGTGKWYRDKKGITVDQCKAECVKDGSKCFAIDHGNDYCNLFTKDKCGTYNSNNAYEHYVKPTSCGNTGMSPTLMHLAWCIFLFCTV